MLLLMVEHTGSAVAAQRAAAGPWWHFDLVMEQGPQRSKPHTHPTIPLGMGNLHLYSVLPCLDVWDVANSAIHLR